MQMKLLSKEWAGVRMNVLLRAACAATLIAATLIVTGCGETFRQVATPNPVPSGNPSGFETEAVLNQCPSGMTCLGPSGTQSASVITAIDVSGDTNAGNKRLDNQVGSVAGPVAGSMAAPIAFDATRTSVFTANTSTDTVTKLSLAPSTAGFAAAVDAARNAQVAIVVVGEKSGSASFT